MVEPAPDARVSALELGKDLLRIERDSLSQVKKLMRQYPESAASFLARWDASNARIDSTEFMPGVTIGDLKGYARRQEAETN